MSHIHRIDIDDEDLAVLKQAQSLIRDAVAGTEVPLEVLLPIALRSADAPDLAAAVADRLTDDEVTPDPVALARIERGREAAMARYRRDRDPNVLEGTMRTLDQEEARARAAHADGITPEEAIESLRELPSLWDDADPSGRKLLAEALFERIDVLGARKVRLHPSASAKAQGWDRAWNGVRLVVMVGARGVEAPLSN